MLVFYLFIYPEAQFHSLEKNESGSETITGDECIGVLTFSIFASTLWSELLPLRENSLSQSSESTTLLQSTSFISVLDETVEGGSLIDPG